MRRIVIVFMSILVVLLTSERGTSQSKSCEQTARDLEAQMASISQNLDKAAFERYAADDLRIIRADGTTAGKREQLASFPKLPTPITISFVTKDLRIRGCNEAIIVTTGKDIVTATDKVTKESGALNYWFIRFYEKRGGVWQLVYNQLTSTDE